MAGNVEHIQPDELRRFLNGETLEESRNETIECHLQNCPACQTIAEEMPADALQLKLRRLHDADESGIRLADRYELLNEIGRGGAGIVYRATQPGLQSDVALKMIVNGSAASAHELQRLGREAAALARIQHPNVVRIFEFGEQDGLPFIAMELIDGPTLDQWLQRLVLSPRDAAKLVSQLADALDHVHQQGVLHRDLKPQNILLAVGRTGHSERSWEMLDDTVIPKITDFGLAAIVDRATHTRTGIPLGTPSYMSP